MATFDDSGVLKVGDWVNIRHSGYTKPGRIVEYRGPLAPGGVRVFRVKMRGRPSPAYIEVREDQLEFVSSETPMSLRKIKLEGTLKPDGTLELDHKPNLSPGRVKVVLRKASEATLPTEDWFQCLQRLRAEREAVDYPFMNEEEANAHLDGLREGDRMDDLLREVDEQQQKAEQP
jgi:hypothetical protein